MRIPTNLVPIAAVFVGALGDTCNSCQVLVTLLPLTPTNCFLMLAYSAVEGCAIVGSLFGTQKHLRCPLRVTDDLVS